MPAGMAFPMVGARNHNWCREPATALFAFKQAKEQVKVQTPLRGLFVVGLSLELKRRNQNTASPNLRTIIGVDAFICTLLSARCEPKEVCSK
jgi:hypothetical protein